MRASAILNTLALATAVIAAPAPRLVKNGDITEANPMDPEGDLAARALDALDTAKNELKSSLAGLKNLAHGASEALPAKISVSARQAGLPTDEVTDVVDEVLKALPVDTDAITGELPLPIRRRQLGLPTTEVTGVVDEVLDALPVDTDSITEEIPLPIRRRQLGLPTTEVTGVVDEVLDALPVDTDSITGELPIPIRRRQLGTTTDGVLSAVDGVADVLPVDDLKDTLPIDLPIRRGELTSLLDPLTSTLTTLVNKFSAVTQGLSSASTKINSMLPANIENGDAVLDNVMSTLATVQPELNSAIDTMQAGDVQGLLSKATTASSGKTMTQMNELIGSSNKMLNQMTQDVDTISGLGVTGYVNKIKSIESTLTSMLSKLKSASGIPLPL